MATAFSDATQDRGFQYVLGYNSAEHDRLIRQAVRIAPMTERLFREAGIGAGQRVLDLGSGVGDVAMLLARLVGPSGEVLGVERDASSIARAATRVAHAGLHNVTFTQSDVNQIKSDKLFDAAVGRFILMFVPDPVSVLTSVSQLVRPGGVVAFQEPSWVPSFARTTHLPLWSSLLVAIHSTLLRSGANPEMGPDLYNDFQRVGLPAPRMHMEILLGCDPDLVQMKCDVMASMRPMADQHNVSLEALGDFKTLPERILAEAAASSSLLNFVPLVGAWTRKPH